VLENEMVKEGLIRKSQSGNLFDQVRMKMLEDIVLRPGDQPNSGILSAYERSTRQ
jgi:hypothetical protein